MVSAADGQSRLGRFPRKLFAAASDRDSFAAASCGCGHAFGGNFSREGRSCSRADRRAFGGVSVRDLHVFFYVHGHLLCHRQFYEHSCGVSGDKVPEKHSGACRGSRAAGLFAGNLSGLFPEYRLYFSDFGDSALRVFGGDTVVEIHIFYGAALSGRSCSRAWRVLCGE